MCGIAGVFGSGSVEIVRDMLGTLIHRGPDDEHVVGNERCAMGARRLSIMDPARGRQPVRNEAGDIWAAHNGEIYNFRQLACELRRAGHQVATGCDSEILPHLYEEHGSALVDCTDGMFASAVWDDARGMGLLARDRMGKKPLYYHVRGDSLYFASEIKALLRIPGFERRLNLEGLHHFLSYKHIPHPLTAFDGIAALPPAHVLVYRPGSTPVLRRYWDVDFSPHGDTHPDRLLQLLREAVSRRLDADVDIGFFLSGGIDSSLVTAMAAEMTGRPLKTFTLTYSKGSTTPEKEEDRRWAGWVADRYAATHIEVPVDGHAFGDELGTILRCFDEPFAGVVSTWFLARLAGRHVKVVMSGDGADELFGSYLSHRLAAERPSSDPWRWRQDLFVFRDGEKGSLYAPEIARSAEEWSSTDRLRGDFSRITARDPLNAMLEAEFRTIFPDQVLAFVDRLSMAHSLEVRSPFLDTAFVRFAAGIPGHLKIRNGETKWLLKQAARRYFPDEMVFRRKEGFVMPVNRWLLNGLSPYVRDTLSPSRIRAAGVFDPAAVARLLSDFYGGAHHHANRILSLLAFQEWQALYRPCLS